MRKSEQIAVVQPFLPPQEPATEIALKEFTVFVKSLDDPEALLRESAVRDLFANGIYNQKLVGPGSERSLPSHNVMEMQRVPAGLQRANTLVKSPKSLDSPRSALTPQANTRSPIKKDRVSYGSWYMPACEWKVQQPICVSPLVPVTEESEKNSETLRRQVCHLPGAKLFREYLEEHKAHVPKCLVMLPVSIYPTHRPSVGRRTTR